MDDEILAVYYLECALFFFFSSYETRHVENQQNNKDQQFSGIL